MLASEPVKLPTSDKVVIKAFSDEVEFMESLNLFTLFSCTLRLVSAPILCESFEFFVFDTIRLRGYTWQFTAEFLFVVMRHIESPHHGQRHLVHLNTLLQEAEAAAARRYPGAPLHRCQEATAAAQQWNGMDTPGSTLLCLLSLRLCGVCCAACCLLSGLGLLPPALLPGCLHVPDMLGHDWVSSSSGLGLPRAFGVGSLLRNIMDLCLAHPTALGPCCCSLRLVGGRRLRLGEWLALARYSFVSVRWLHLGCCCWPCGLAFFVACLCLGVWSVVFPPTHCVSLVRECSDWGVAYTGVRFFRSRLSGLRPRMAADSERDSASSW